MIIFGIESSCDDTACAVLEINEDNGEKILNLKSSAVSSQTDLHKNFGGVVPEIASRAHSEIISFVAKKALDDAEITYSDIDAVAVTFAPGLIGSLLVGVSFAKALALALDVPLIPVNHIQAHVSAAHISHPELPQSYLAMVISGGHTSFYDVCDYEFSEIGATRDDACGEAFDKVGRVMGLTYPCGYEMNMLADEGYKRESYKNLTLPSPALKGEGYDFSFSGLKTASINLIHNIVQKKKLGAGSELDRETKEDIAAAFTESVRKGIGTNLEKILKGNNYSHFVLAGGVAANSHIRKTVIGICEKYHVRACIPKTSFCGDNAAMVCAAGYINMSLKIRADEHLNAFASDEAAERYIREIMAKT